MREREKKRERERETKREYFDKLYSKIILFQTFYFFFIIIF